MPDGSNPNVPGNGELDDDNDDSGGDLSSTLSRFAKNPTAFIFGAILGRLLDGLQAVWEAVVSGVYALFVGSDPTSTAGTWGLVDIPLYFASLLSDAGGAVASPVESWTGSMAGAAVDFALLFGPLSPFILTVEAALAIALVYLGLRTLVRVGIDVLPGGGGLLS